MPIREKRPSAWGQKSISSPLPWPKTTAGAERPAAASAGGIYQASTLPWEVSSQTPSTPIALRSAAGALGRR
jgi:hypothetical protein